MSKDLYHFEASPFCRSVRLTAEAVGVKLNLIVRNIEEHNPDIIAINPTHTVPTFVDGDLKMWESRAIMAYLVSQYGDNDHLYPKDPKIRAHVDKLLYFDCGTLCVSLWAMVGPVIQKKAERVSEEAFENFKKSIGHVESFLEGKKWIAGTEKFSLADIAIAVTLSAPKEAGLTYSNHPNIKSWMLRCEREFPEYAKINLPGAKALAIMFPSSLDLSVM